MNQTNKIFKSVGKEKFVVLGMAVGVLAVIFGIIILSQDNVSTVDLSTTFGADYYTESYKAMAYSVRNIAKLYELVSKGIGFLLIVFGLSDICYFGNKGSHTLVSIDESKNTIDPNELPDLD